MARLNAHGTELDRREYPDCRVAVMSDGSLMPNQGFGWKTWKPLKAGADPASYAARLRAAYGARPAEFHAYIGALAAACDLEARARLNVLVDQMPDDPDAGLALFDDFSYDLRIEDAVRCCRARKAWATNFPGHVLAQCSEMNSRTVRLPTRRFHHLRQGCHALLFEQLYDSWHSYCAVADRL